ncbi:uncharacterized protein LOC127547013 [Antechinus flavipes]|uniref:uncharacterized protein LOC127547013 n=1 Tax=Antechinus flavipes TaxID=38775 RepID=UPI0022365152|nr:uncharacterized protein LOC127547013 [Antechinus flavipes]
METLEHHPLCASLISAMFAWSFSIQLSRMKILPLWGLIFFCCLLTMTLAQHYENVPSNLQANKLQLGYYWKNKSGKAEKVQDLDCNSTSEAYSLCLYKFMEQSIISALFDASKTVETPNTAIGKLMQRAESKLQQFLELNITNGKLFHIRIQTVKKEPRLSSKILVKFNMEFKVPVTKQIILPHVIIAMPTEVRAEKDEKNKIHLALGSLITEDNHLNSTIT